MHKLTVKNAARVVSLSMHRSGRMLLALYGNGVLRLWNMLDARCLFKKKVGLSGSEGYGDGEEEEGDVRGDGDLDAVEDDAVEEEREDAAATKRLKSEQARQVLKQFDALNVRPV